MTALLDCKGCGLCCKRFFLKSSREVMEKKLERAVKNPEQVRDNPKSLKRMLEIFNWKSYSSSTMRWECSCSCLIKNKDGTMYCKEYDKRPDVCRDYPKNKIEFKRCVYWNKDNPSLKDGINQLLSLDKKIKLKEGLNVLHE